MSFSKTLLDLSNSVSGYFQSVPSLTCHARCAGVRLQSRWCTATSASTQMQGVQGSPPPMNSSQMHVAAAGLPEARGHMAVPPTALASHGGGHRPLQPLPLKEAAAISIHFLCLLCNAGRFQKAYILLLKWRVVDGWLSGRCRVVVGTVGMVGWLSGGCRAIVGTVGDCRVVVGWLSGIASAENTAESTTNSCPESICWVS